MTMVWVWLRLEWRLRWRSLLVLAVLIGLAGAVVFTAVAGARRGTTATDRLLATSRSAEYLVAPNQPGFDWDQLRALPEVRALMPVAYGGFVVDGIPAEDGAVWGTPVGPDAFTKIERPVILSGRAADQGRPDEATVTPGFAERYGLGPGDTVTLRLYLPATMDAINAGAPPPTPDGPAVDVRITGVIRTFDLSGTPRTPGGLVATPALFDRYRANLLGATESTVMLGYVRLDGGEAGLAGFMAGLAEVTGRTDIDVWSIIEGHTLTRRTADFESAVLLAFGLAGLAASVFLIGTALARHVATTAEDLAVLRSLGMTPRQAIAAGTAGPAAAGAIGAGIGVLGAVVASRWMPVGIAALMEPDPGIDVDLPVLALGWLCGVGLVVLAAGLGTWRAEARRLADRAAPRRSAIAGAASRIGLPLPVAIGTRLALESGRGRTAVSVRPALVGSVVGVLGVIAALTYLAGSTDAAHNPLRTGQTHQLQAYFGFAGHDTAPAADILARWSADPDVAGVHDCRVGVAGLGPAQQSLNLYTYHPVGTPVDVVMVDGRLPKAADEIALGPFDLRSLGLEVGSSVELTGDRGTVIFTVTGSAFVPEGVGNYYMDGGWLTPGGFDRLFAGFKYHVGYLALRDGADPGTVIPRLDLAAGTAGPNVQLARQATYTVDDLERTTPLPIALAGFLALLATGAVEHALASAVRRRRRDLAVLRAVGMTPRQCRGVVMTQATVLAVVGLAFGVPLGVALGRVLWRVVADYTPVAYEPPVAVLALVLAGPLTLLVAVLVAVVPARRAARLRPAHILRAE